MPGLLGQLRTVRDVNYLAVEEMEALCREMREADGGLGAGVCELAVALHRVFDVPPDRVVWGDASVLRACSLIRADYGPPDHDPIGTALGWTRARDLKKQKHLVLAVDSHAVDRRLSGRDRARMIVIHTRTHMPPPARSSILPAELLGKKKKRPSMHEPVDGRNLADVMHVLEQSRSAAGLQRIEVLVEPSRRHQEADPVALSGPIPTFKEVVVQTLFEMARAGSRFVLVGPYPGPIGRAYPDRYVEWDGPSEHTLAVASSLAGEGISVVAVVRASEIPRCLPLMSRKIASRLLPVTLIVDEDDADLYVASLRVLPGMSIYSPADENDARSMVAGAVGTRSPVAVCCPRGAGVGVPLIALEDCEPEQKAEVIAAGQDISILALGRAVYPGILAVQKLTGYGIRAGLVNMRCVRPLDESVLQQLAADGIKYFLTVEESTVVGGMGPAVMEALHRLGITGIQVRTLGRGEAVPLEGGLGPHDPDAIVAGVLAFLSPPA